MFKEKKDYLILLCFLGLIFVLVMANLSQSKDTAKFISLESPEKETIGEEKSKSDVVREMMATTLPAVAPDGDLISVKLEELETFVYTHQGDVKDVTDGKDINGLVTEGKAKGVVQVFLKDNAYYLLTKFNDLPSPPEGYYYEGWVARQKPFRFESAGKLQQPGKVFVNYFGSTKDLMDHDFYVVTLEPDDGDPAPSTHILEGEIFPN